MLIQHITIATGDCVSHRLDTVAPSAVAACRALLPNGGPMPAIPAFRVEVVGRVFTVFRGLEPLVSCGVGYGDDAIWQALHSLQIKFGPVKATAPGGHWIAVVFLPALASTAQGDIGWLADFERCMAAAILLPNAPRLAS